MGTAFGSFYIDRQIACFRRALSWDRLYYDPFIARHNRLGEYLVSVLAQLRSPLPRRL